MRGHRLMLSLIVVALIVPIALVSAQNTLTPNITITNVSLLGNGSDFYSVDLEEGSWTVLVVSDSFWGMLFRVEVSLDSDMSNILDEAQGAGNLGVSVNFNIDSDRLVYIRVTEIGGQSGFYSIGWFEYIYCIIGCLDHSDSCIGVCGWCHLQEESPSNGCSGRNSNCGSGSCNPRKIP